MIGVISARPIVRMQEHAPTRTRCMKRSLALSITSLLLSMAASATAESLPAPRYSLLRIEAVSAPVTANRYRVSSDITAATAAGRFRLLGADAEKAAGDACESGNFPGSCRQQRDTRCNPRCIGHCAPLWRL